MPQRVRSWQMPWLVEMGADTPKEVIEALLATTLKAHVQERMTFLVDAPGRLILNGTAEGQTRFDTLKKISDDIRNATLVSPHYEAKGDAQIQAVRDLHAQKSKLIRQTLSDGLLDQIQASLLHDPMDNLRAHIGRDVAVIPLHFQYIDRSEDRLKGTEFLCHAVPGAVNMLYKIKAKSRLALAFYDMRAASPRISLGCYPDGYDVRRAAKAWAYYTGMAVLPMLRQGAIGKFDKVEHDHNASDADYILKRVLEYNDMKVNLELGDWKETSERFPGRVSVEQYLGSPFTSLGTIDSSCTLHVVQSGGLSSVTLNSLLSTNDGSLPRICYYNPVQAGFAADHGAIRELERPWRNPSLRPRFRPRPGYANRG